ncbi:MAG: cobaltochelatase subunit CobN, partial [Gammaproteobacteria bacterium]
MIIFISAADTELLLLEGAIRQLPAAFPPVRAFLSTRLQTDAELDALLADAGSEARIFVVRVLGGRSFFERGFERLCELCQSRQRWLLAFPGDRHPDPELAALSTVPLTDLSAAFEYLIAGGVENYKNLLLFLADAYLSTAYGFEAPAPAPSEGLYHPDAIDTLTCATRGLAAFREAYWKEGRPAIGMLFYRAHWQSGNLAVIDALVRELEGRECNVLPVFCYSLRDAATQAMGVPRAYSHYFSDDGRPSVDCIISLLSYALADLHYDDRSTRAGSAALDYTTALGIPVIQAITTSLTVNEWRASERGITPLDAAMNVVMPEFDGRIISVPLAFKHEVAGASPVEVRRSASLPNRLQAVAALALRYAALRRKPNVEKRLCIMLTNFANKQGRIGGAVGLDTPASVIELLRALKNRGYRIGEIPPDGDALMAELIASGGYDQDFLTDDQMRRAAARYTAARYAQWFGELPAQNQSALRQAWGEPPGEVYRDGDHVYVAGLRFGNVLVMIQPPRGFGENPLAVYHSGDLIPTHQYLGAYRWLREEFRADALIHCGKHGTLEWLPGKGLGLSEACYPELAIRDIPVFYPFIVNDPGEGTQAKRRMHACIIDHLIPPMTRAETYDDLARLQQLLGDYAQADRVDPDKLPLIMQAIWDLVVSANLHCDLGVELQPEREAYGELIQHIDGYLCELGDLQIRDGLHVLGRLPEGERLVNLALALVRLDAPGVPGLRRAIADDLGLDYARISDSAHLGKPCDPANGAGLAARLLEGTPHRTHGDLLNAVERLGRRLIERLAAADFDPDELGLLLRTFGLPAEGQAAATLGTLVHNIVPALRRTRDEIDNLLDGLEGR